MKASQLLVPSALATSVLSIALLAIALATGVSQEHFEVVAPAAEFARHLVASAGPLKLDFAVDLVFIAAYTLFALAWSAHSLESGGDRWLIHLGLGCLLLTALLDVIEDTHILAMLAGAEQRMELSETAISVQMAESQTKFAISYAGIATLALGWPARGGMAAAVRGLALLGIPLGVAIFVISGPWVPVLALVRASIHIIGPLLVVAALQQRMRA